MSTFTNGRIRSLPSFPATPPHTASSDDKDSNYSHNNNGSGNTPTDLLKNEKNIDTSFTCPSQFSVLPNTLPAGLLTIHDAKNETSCKPLNRCNLSSIHSLNGATGIHGANKEEDEQSGDVILDHCWTYININDLKPQEGSDRELNEEFDKEKSDEDKKDDTEKDEEKKVVLVLAVLFRKCHPNRQPFLHSTTRQLKYDSQEQQHAYKQENSKEYNAENNEDSNEKNNKIGDSISPLPQSSPLLSKHGAASIIRLYCSSISHDSPKDNDASIGDLIHVKSISLPNFASSISLSHQFLVIQKSNGVALYNLLNLLQNYHDLFNGDKEMKRISYNETMKPIELMKTHVIHAMTISHPYLVVVSGHQVGIWNLDNLLRSFKIGEKRGAIDAAIWSTVISGYNQRITSVVLSEDGMILCLSCWDGAAFVYRATSYSSYPEQKRKKGYDKWERIGHADNGGKLSFVPPWETPPKQTTECNFPTFVALSPYDDSGPSSSLQSVLMAVSTPGSNIIRCFDLDTGKQCPDFATNRKEGKYYDGLVAPSVQGMFSVKLDSPSVLTKTMKPKQCKNVDVEAETSSYLVWIDENDMIHTHAWPKQSFLSSPSNNLYSSLFQNNIFMGSILGRTLWRLKVSSADESLYDGRNGANGEAWLMHSDAQNINRHDDNGWKIECIWSRSPSSSNSKNVCDVIDLPFLSDEHIMDLVVWDRYQVAAAPNTENIIKEMTTFKCSQRTPSFALLGENYFGICIPSDVMIYIYGRREGGWKVIDIESCWEDDNTSPNNNTSFEGNVSLSNVIVSQAWFIMSHCIIAMLTKDDNASHTSCLAVGLWDLSKDDTTMNKMHLTLGERAKKIKRIVIGSIRIYLFDDDPTSILLSCDAVTIEGGKYAMLLWAISLTKPESMLSSEPILLSFQWLRNNDYQITFLGGHRRVVNGDGCNKNNSIKADEITLHFNINGFNWRYDPFEDIWNPVG